MKAIVGFVFAAAFSAVIDATSLLPAEKVVILLTESTKESSLDGLMMGLVKVQNARP